MLQQEPGSSGVAMIVSILTGPGGPVLRGSFDSRLSASFSFNPHRARRPGATTAYRTTLAAPRRFNPHRARRPGATLRKGQRHRVCRSFNPHRARRPGATALPRIVRSLPSGFNPHRARRPGATCAFVAEVGATVSFQSSPGPEARCYMRYPPFRFAI